MSENTLWVSLNPCGELYRVWSIEPAPDHNGYYWYGEDHHQKKSDLVAEFLRSTTPVKCDLHPGSRGEMCRHIYGSSTHIYIGVNAASIKHSLPKSPAQLQKEIADLAIQYAGNDNMMPGEEFFKLVKQYRQVKDSAK